MLRYFLKTKNMAESATEDKKEDKVDKKEARRLARLEEENARAAALEYIAEDIEKDWYGYLPLQRGITTSRVWIELKDLDKSLAGTDVWVRSRLQDIRGQSHFSFIVLRSGRHTAQALLLAKGDFKAGGKWTNNLPKESVLDIFATVTIPEDEIRATTQKVELFVKKIFCVSKADPILPFQLKDANRPDLVDEKEDDGQARVLQDIRLDYRIIDLRTLTNHAIFRLQSAICELFREYLRGRDFIEIHTPKMIGGASEGGANVFKFQYFGRDACLAQSPQLYKQMAICGDLDRVFEIGPVFRAENSNTHRHLCEFTGLDFEMTIRENYHEVLDTVSELFKFIFKNLKERFSEEIEAVFQQHPNREFKWIEKTPKIDFQEGMKMLKDAGVNIPDDLSEYDMSTEVEKTLGKLVYEKYDTDFYMLINYPLGVRPFYTMPRDSSNKWSNSYDVFMRGEEIISGAQRIHDPALLAERAKTKGIPLLTIQPYIDAFKYGAFPHGGAGVGLERVVMLFLGLPNIRKTSMFPRDPKRIEP
eukprot:GHVP01014121.1.p1 GENE.GHVP01014121.1~~GHVP01014121.1.p1  ORF type:complete len:532 (+),score=91.56 GHVP01014121.1:1065-2660(+)